MGRSLLAALFAAKSSGEACLHIRTATIGRNDLSGDSSGIFASEKGNQAGDVFGLAQPA